eukprot:748632-Hanusia_phi.AAC.1
MGQVTLLRGSKDFLRLVGRPVFFRVNYALASACKLIFPTEMEKIEKVTSSLDCSLPDKLCYEGDAGAESCSHVEQTALASYNTVWVLPDTFPFLNILRECFESHSNILYMDLTSNATVTEGCVALECEVHFDLLYSFYELMQELPDSRQICIPVEGAGEGEVDRGEVEEAPSNRLRWKLAG